MRRPHPFVASSSILPAQPVSDATNRASQRRSGLAVACLLAGLGLGASSPAQAKPFMEYLKPMAPVAPLSDATWGVDGVIPRDISNGIESTKGKGVHPEYYYWDGQIIRAKDGKYHMFMSTFGADSNFGMAWMGSDAYHATSETNVLGPYVRKDFVYNNNGSHKGHNVSAAELPDGTYVVIVSEIVPFTIYKSTSLDGPWTGCSPQTDVGASNISFFPRHDGKFEITERNGGLAISDTLCGHYVRQKPKCSYPTANGDTIYPKRTSTPGVPNPTYNWQEDPHIWRSGGTYHIIYSGSGDRVGWHVYSPDGINDWKDNGYAWSPRDYQKIFCYEGSTHCDAWYKMERPSVVLQDGHPTHITWAVSDVDKDNQVLPGTNHGTKVVVVPFDGVAFDQDFGDGKGGSGGGGAGGSGGAGGVGGAGGARTGGSTGGGGAAGGGGIGGGGASGGAGTGGSVSGGQGGSSTGGTVISGGKTGGSVAPSGGSAGTSSSTGGSAAGSTGGSAAGAPGTGGSGGSSQPVVADNGNSGCSCNLSSTSHDRAFIPGLLLGALGMLVARRRSRNRG